MTRTTILVVEDERIIAKGLEKRLKGLGYAVVGSASTGEEATRKAAELRPDLILMDIHLGDGMDGVDAAQEIRSTSDVPVVYLTANSDDATFQRAKLTEPHGFVLKPYDDKDLHTAIEIGVYRHAANRRARENEEWLAATLGGIGDGVIATHEEGRIRFMNSVAQEITGWSGAEALGEEMADVFRVVEEATGRTAPNLALDAVSGGEVVRFAKAMLLVDRIGAERPIEASAAPIRDVSGRFSGAVLVFRDVTERRSLERRLEDQRRELLDANLRLEALADTDALTKLNNRRAFQVKLTEEVQRAKRVPAPLSLMLLDVDHFKRFNDTFGHPAGDGVLRGVARLLKENARATDFVARYGGEEFAILLPCTDATDAIAMAERMSLVIAEGEWRERAITVSIGLATLCAGDTAESLVAQADGALYRSKENGRNRVHHANETGPVVAG